MKTNKKPISTIYKLANSPRANQKIIKASDIKLNDVLINGMQLRCFKAIKNKGLSFERNKTNEDLETQDQNARLSEDRALFNNNTIKRRLKSLETQKSSVFKTIYETFTPKKSSSQAKQCYKNPISMLKPLPTKANHQIVNNQSFCQAYRLFDANTSYYSHLNKQLLMNSAHNRFNSILVKNKIQFRKYTSFKAEKQKKHISIGESKQIERDTEINGIQQQFERYQSMNPKDMKLKRSLDSSRPQQYTQLFNNNDQIQTIDAETFNQPYNAKNNQEKHGLEDSFNKKLKICYSTKYKFRQQDTLNKDKANDAQTSRSKYSQANLEVKLISSMGLQGKNSSST